MLRKNAKIELLKRIPLFSGCNKSELAAIAMIVDEIDLPAGKVLIREGDPGREFLILVEGTVEVRQKGRKLPAKSDAGFFGEISLLSNTPTTASVTATSAVYALVITPQSFRDLLRRSPGIQLKVLTALAERLAPETI
jgi:CRP/FNR family transcriptional regulator, cyclic AMP receptor protein